VANRLVNDRPDSAGFGDGLDTHGTRVGEAVTQRLGRRCSKLGGNNAIIVAPSANMDLAVRGLWFGAVGTAGQRCNFDAPGFCA